MNNSGYWKRTREKEVIQNDIFQGAGDVMVPLAETGKLQGNWTSEGEDKFS